MSVGTKTLACILVTHTIVRWSKTKYAKMAKESFSPDPPETRLLETILSQISTEVSLLRISLTIIRLPIIAYRTMRERLRYIPPRFAPLRSQRRNTSQSLHHCTIFYYR